MSRRAFDSYLTATKQSLTISHPSFPANQRLVIMFQLSLQLRTINFHICGASIISHSWAISAVQCTRGRARKDADCVMSGSVYECPSLHRYMPSLLGLRAGSSLHQSGGTVHSVAQLIEHPLYDDFTNENDIALLRVSRGLSGPYLGVLSTYRRVLEQTLVCCPHAGEF
uniref:Peptidase S1 domain-containing protein n=1 Tax=Timema shepardi TaxID=629360 RepID=A0A7R9BAY3_TIMSH|nr:unnamed protein product [Timema shepardi]